VWRALALGEVTCGLLQKSQATFKILLCKAEEETGHTVIQELSGGKLSPVVIFHSVNL